MATSNPIANDFIVLYYQNFTYDQSRISQFYSPSADITRKNVKKTLNEISSEELVPKIQEGTQIEIVNCEIQNENEDSFNLNIFGNYIFDEQTQKLTQKFKLSKENNKWFVVSDVLEFVDVKEPLVCKEELKEIAPFRRNNSRKNSNSRSRNKNKFAPYIPSQENK